MARTINGDIQIKDDSGQTVHRLDAETGRAFFGATGQDGLLFMNNRDGRSTVRMHGSTGNVNVGGNGQDGDLLIENAEGQRTIRLQGRHGSADLGSNGTDGRLFLKDRNGDNIVRLTSSDGHANFGGEGKNGDLRLINGSNRSTIRLNGKDASATLGNTGPAAGPAGDLTVTNEVGEPTIQLDGGFGESLLGSGVPIQMVGEFGIITANLIFESSDSRRKDNITSLSKTLNKVLAMRGVSYKRKHARSLKKQSNDSLEIGFLAQEVESVFPEVVFTDTEGNKSLSYSRLTPVLVEAIKEQQALIQEQASALKGMMAKITKLETAMA
ncbi:MAG: hypothetical protein NPIRA04_23640 [Nitrospirales bacterium]|nr:MAG: hypothetical protein NPIRA04_23640 [Nitrospirales bacterium]